MQKIMNIFRWAVTVFFLLMMVTGGISAVFFGLALLLTVPIKKLIDEVIVMGYDSCGNCHPQQEYPILLEECSIMNSKLAALILTIAVSLSMLSCQKEMSDYEKTKADFLENAKRIESALQEVHPDLKSLGYTEVKNVSYEIRSGGDIQYYFCKTTYFDEIPKLNGVHLEAVQSVVDIDNAEDSKESKIQEYDAIIYTLNEREYLCWTISPEISCILEYTPGTVSDEDIRLMAESVQ